MYYRHKLILALLEALGGRIEKAVFQPLLFLLCRKQEKPTFEFIPGKTGALSLQARADLQSLVQKGLVVEDELHFKTVGEGFLPVLLPSDRSALQSLLQEIGERKGDERYPRVQGPFSAIPGPWKDEEQEAGPVLFTLGYEGRSIDGFLNALMRRNIKLLCDVRKNAFSMKPGFSKKPLQEALQEAGIGYRHIPELGIDSEKRKGLEGPESRVRLFEEYERKTLPAAEAGVREALRKLREQGRMALLCFERNPGECHRSRLAVALRRTAGFDFPVVHIGDDEAQEKEVE